VEQDQRSETEGSTKEETHSMMEKYVDTKSRTHDLYGPGVIGKDIYKDLMCL